MNSHTYTADKWDRPVWKGRMGSLCTDLGYSLCRSTRVPAACPWWSEFGDLPNLAACVPREAAPEYRPLWGPAPAASWRGTAWWRRQQWGARCQLSERASPSWQRKQANYNDVGCGEEKVSLRTYGFKAIYLNITTTYLAKLSHMPCPPYLEGSRGAPTFRTMTFSVTLRPRSPASFKRFCTSIDKLVRKLSASSTCLPRGEWHTWERATSGEADRQTGGGALDLREADVVVHLSGHGLPLLFVADGPVVEAPAEAEQRLSGPGSKLLLQLGKRHLQEVPARPHAHSSQLPAHDRSNACRHCWAAGHHGGARWRRTCPENRHRRQRCISPGKLVTGRSLMKSSTSSDLRKWNPSGLAFRVANRANRMLDPEQKVSHFKF